MTFQKTSRRVLIVGGGIVGTAAAYYLAQRGAQVTLLEKHVVGSKASGVNFGGLRINGRDPPELPLSIRAREFWRRIREHVGHDCDVELSGHLEITQREQQMAAIEEWVRTAREFGLAPQILSVAEIRERYPYVNHEHLVGGCLMADDGSANPRLATPFIALAAKRAGADIREHAAVAHVEHDGRGFRLMTSSSEEFRGDVLINAAGAWGGKIAESLGDVVPWFSIAPQMAVSEPLSYRIEGTVECKVGDRYLYMRQIPRGNVLFGRGPGKVDFEAERAFVLPQNNFNASNIALGMVPLLRTHHIIRTWSGIEGKMPDSMPVLDFSPKVPGLIHAFCFSGHGFQLGPGTGAVLAELALDGRTSTDIKAFKVDRFSKAAQPASESNREPA